ncbi:Cytochrome p450 [Thalictrum thalictroides]|uniref:Cytochrome p450 n=1 Tax=Thalictrum thalictroides TaxID=46969 RepID=A0A7J6WL80_THATH|nr:Cytochrome p450 [Thalictrum thalictroides]
MLKTNFDNYPKGKPFSTILGDLLGRGIFNVDGNSWKFQRKMASLELGSVSIRSYAFEVATNEIYQRLIPLLSSYHHNGGLLDLQDVFRRFAFDNICRFSFGIDPGCLQLSLPMSDLAVAFDLASKLSAERALSFSPLIWKFKRFFKLGSEKKLNEAISMVNILADEVINQRRRLGFTNHQDLLSRFMGSSNDDKYLKDIVISFLLAGRDTVASALTSFFMLLSQYPEVESTILAESNRVMKPNQEIVCYKQLSEMPYLQACLYECMRLFPPVQFDSKFAQEDDVLPDGTFVRKGTRVTYHPYAMGRMEEVWGPNANEFKPERWLIDGVFVNQSPYKYPVFQAGLRVCLGKEMALVEMKCVVLSLIRRFQIKPTEPSLAPKFAPGLTATIRGGLPVRVIDRKSLHLPSI